MKIGKSINDSSVNTKGNATIAGITGIIMAVCAVITVYFLVIDRADNKGTAPSPIITSTAQKPPISREKSLEIVPSMAHPKDDFTSRLQVPIFFPDENSIIFTQELKKRLRAKNITIVIDKPQQGQQAINVSSRINAENFDGEHIANIYYTLSSNSMFDKIEYSAVGSSIISKQDAIYVAQRNTPPLLNEHEIINNFNLAKNKER